MNQVVSTADGLPDGLLEKCPKLPFPTRLLMCPPQHFSIIDEKNPHMRGKAGTVDRAAAEDQWDQLNAAFASCGMNVDVIEPVEGLEDMVFAANQTFTGTRAGGGKLCVMSNMKHASRQKEVPAYEKWFATHDYETVGLPESLGFEGGGDALWHPGRRLIWCGYGYRSDAGAAEQLAEKYDVTVLRLHLQDERFYHLDTCLAALTEKIALLYPPALDETGVALVKALFSDVIEVPEEEALSGMACNACGCRGEAVVIQEGNDKTVAALRKRGLDVHEVDTGEFLKSGGSVYCMKQYVF